MKRFIAIFLAAFCVLHSDFSQSVLTANGLASFIAPATGGGGGGDITTSMTHRWQCEEGSGTTLSDSIGSDTGTLHGSVGWTSGQIGSSALSFPGASGSGITLASGVNTSTTFTIAAWVFRSTGAGGYENLFTQNSTAGFWIKAGKIDFFFAGADHLSNTLIPLGWHHIAMTCSAGSYTFYLDSVADGTGTGFSSNISINCMGADNGTGGEPLTGNLDDIRFYTRALTATDISTLYAFR
jgi:hypothetical protein